MAALAFFYSNYLLLHWQLLILVLVGFLGSITFFLAEWKAESSRRESDYDSIWLVCAEEEELDALLSPQLGESPRDEDDDDGHIPASADTDWHCGMFFFFFTSVQSLLVAAGTKTLISNKSEGMKRDCVHQHTPPSASFLTSYLIILCTYTPGQKFLNAPIFQVFIEIWPDYFQWITLNGTEVSS